jgi:hypothetical protein
LAEVAGAVASGNQMADRASENFPDELVAREVEVLQIEGSG